MAATERLYYIDSYRTEFDAQITDKSADGKRLYLDVTAFYPTSGGQPHDLGMIEGIPIQEVVDEGERIAHILDHPIGDRPIELTRVHCQVDWPRRYDHMQQHTGQHLLSAVIADLFEIPTVSFHLGADVSTIELETPEFSDDQIEQAEQRANQLAWQAKAVTVTSEDAQTASGLRKASERTGILRIVDIENIDRSACGGTHVRSTAELGPIQLRKTEKIRGNIRLEFVCGARSLRRARQDFLLLTDLSKQTSVAFDGLPNHVHALRQRLIEAEKDRQRTAIELATLEANALYDAMKPDDQGIRRILMQVPALNEEIRAKAQALTSRSKAIVLVVGTQPSTVLLAVSKDSGIDAGALLKHAFREVGGRGGGSAVLAQGSLPDGEAWKHIAVAAGFPNDVQ